MFHLSFNLCMQCAWVTQPCLLRPFSADGSPEVRWSPRVPLSGWVGLAGESQCQKKRADKDTSEEQALARPAAITHLIGKGCLSQVFSHTWPSFGKFGMESMRRCLWEQVQYTHNDHRVRHACWLMILDGRQMRVRAHVNCTTWDSPCHTLAPGLHHMAVPCTTSSFPLSSCIKWGGPAHSNVSRKGGWKAQGLVKFPRGRRT